MCSIVKCPHCTSCQNDHEYIMLIGSLLVGANELWLVSFASDVCASNAPEPGLNRPPEYVLGYASGARHCMHVVQDGRLVKHVVQHSSSWGGGILRTPPSIIVVW